MTQRPRLDDLTSDQLDDLYEQLDLLDATATALGEQLARATAERDQLRHLRAVAGIHFQAIGHHLNDAGIRLPDPVYRLCRLLDDELTLTLEALAEQHPNALAAPTPAATELQEQQ